MNPDKLQKLQSQINYQFNDPKLLRRALTHRSYLNEAEQALKSNERLEFLGDAVLELLISRYLFKNQPQQPEGVLTAARSAIVRTESLAKIAQNLNLGDYLFLSRGEEQTGGRQNEHLLANTTEALVGAIYLDGGLEACQSFIQKNLLPLAQNILSKPLKDPKSKLQEKIQAKGYPSPTYQTIKQSGPDHDTNFTIAVIVNGTQLATGQGKNKQSAQQNAARKALIQVPKLEPKS